MSTLWTGTTDEQEHYYWEKSPVTRELEIEEITSDLESTWIGSIITTGVGIGVTVAGLVAWSIFK